MKSSLKYVGIGSCKKLNIENKSVNIKIKIWFCQHLIC